MINNITDLARLLKLCRKQGVTEIELGCGLKLKLGELPYERGENAQDPDVTDPYSGFPEGELTPEQLLFYSSGGLPQDDPALKGKDS